LLLRVAQWVVPAMDVQDGAWWIIDDTGLPKQGEHSVGVARQYCGMLGQQDNCQVAVSVSLTCQAGSLPVAWQLYLPQSWADDPVRRKKAGVPAQAQFATKPQIALAQLERLMEQGAPRHCVLADAGYGVDTAFRERLSALDLPYVVGITGQVTAWPPGHAPLPPRPSCGRGVVPVRQRLGPVAAPGQEPTLPTHYKPRGSPAHAAPRPLIDHEFAVAYRRSLGDNASQVSVLSACQREA